MEFVILGAVLGASCALLRRRVFLTVALSALLAVIGMLGGTLLHIDPWMTAAVIFGSVAAMQSVYVAVSLTLHFVRFRKLMPPIQTAIGHRLRAELEVPRSLPPELSTLVAQLKGV
jgi:acyl dehydratase